jgi:hypothetical protein
MAMSKMTPRWVSNTYGPSVPPSPPKGHWLADKVIMSPKATDHYTVDELRRMAMVGVYVMEPAVTPEPDR